MHYLNPRHFDESIATNLIHIPQIIPLRNGQNLSRSEPEAVGYFKERVYTAMEAKL